MSDDTTSRLTGEPFSLTRLSASSRSSGLVRRGDDWFHLSHRGQTVKLRPIIMATTDNDVDRIDETKARRLRLEVPAERDELAAFGTATLYAGWSIDDATDGRDSILRGADPTRPTGQRDVVSGQRDLVPQTRLRHFYRTVRDFGDKAVHVALLDNARRRAGRELALLFSESYRHLLHYDNSTETFGDENRPARDAEADGFAFRVVNEFSSKRAWQGVPAFGCSYVSREVCPLRTTGSRFDDFRSARSSGAGGIDVLLRSDDGGLPIIGEVKSRNDTNLFLALIQSLTYAAELVTPAQRRRLASSYGSLQGAWAHRDDGPHADIYILYEQGTDPHIEAGTFDLATKVMKQPELAERIRRIAFFSCKADGGVEDLRLAHRAG